MKALSVHPVFATLIATGYKTVECRSWKTSYRGDILICSTNKKVFDTIPGHALAVVTLKDIVPFTRDHLERACMDNASYEPGLYAWIIENPRIIKPIPVKGKLSLWNFEDDSKIEFLPVPKNDEEDMQLYEKYWKPIAIL